MSGFVSEPERDLEIQRASKRYGEAAQTPGQRHDRMAGDASDTSPAVVMKGRTEGESQVEVDITAGQKMLSAVSGSLLTSLLGRHTSMPFFFLDVLFTLLQSNS